MTDLLVEESEETEETFDAVAPDVSHLITEDETPVDNLFSAKQQRLLVEPLYSSWHPVQHNTPRLYLADANVGIFNTPHNPAIVPDMFLSLDVEVAENWYAKEHRSYFLWEFGKPPEVVVEIVSNTKGGELTKKPREYARMRIEYYVVYDPQQLIQNSTLVVYQLQLAEYIPLPSLVLEGIGLGLTLWEGTFEGKQAQWLRWTDLDGNLILTGAERAELAEARTARLLAQLRAAGLEPEA